MNLRRFLPKKESIFSNKGLELIEDIRKKTLTNNQIIEEIHENFFTEVDKLLQEAKISHSLDTNKQTLIDKCNRLKALGFTNTKEVKDAELELNRLNLLKNENSKKKLLTEAIEYFSFKYPNYKFITEDSVKKICEKYNLVYGEIDRYIGVVPDKNLKHIEDFKISEEDDCYTYKKSSLYMYRNDFSGKRYVKKEIMDKFTNNIDLKDNNGYYHNFEKNLLEIVAPSKDFNMENMEIKNFKLSKVEIPDPVVLKPVIFNNTKHYLIVTAWGLESNDELVINQKFN